jgi:hypothetical protein
MSAWTTGDNTDRQSNGDPLAIQWLHWLQWRNSGVSKVGFAALEVTMLKTPEVA